MYQTRFQTFPQPTVIPIPLSVIKGLFRVRFLEALR